MNANPLLWAQDIKPGDTVIPFPGDDPMLVAEVELSSIEKMIWIRSDSGRFYRLCKTEPVEVTELAELVP